MRHVTAEQVCGRTARRTFPDDLVKRGAKVGLPHSDEARQLRLAVGVKGGAENLLDAGEGRVGPEDVLAAGNDAEVLVCAVEEPRDGNGPDAVGIGVELTECALECIEGVDGILDGRNPGEVVLAQAVPAR